MGTRHFPRSVFFYVLCVLPLAGCGKKGDPSAPRAVVPARIENLSAHPQGRAIVLGWSVPRKNTDDSELLDLKGFKILRSVSTFDSACSECPKRFSLLYEMDYETYLLSNPRAAAVQFSDTDLSVRTVYTYSILCYNAAHQLSREARTGDIFWDVPGMPPGGLQGRLEDKSVVLSWVEPAGPEDGSPLQGAAGYNLYRRGRDEAYPLLPLNPEPIAALACRDRGVEADRDYFYLVRSVRKVGETLIESEGSEEVAVSTTDRTPPEVPAGLIAIPTEGGVVLKWDTSAASDLRGYNLYRKRGDEPDYSKVTPAPVPIAGYFDASVEAGQTYTYAVTAVDDARDANESSRSAGVTVRYSR